MRPSTALFVLGCGLLTACGKGDKPPAPTSGSPQAKPETGPGDRAQPEAPANEPAPATAMSAAEIFKANCANCHGPEGRGDGPVAASMNPKPRDYSDAAWQASVTDDELKRIILKGGAALGKSAMMPPNPQLKDQPQVLDDLVKIIRGFGKK
ncbi:MAG: cytochrome c [Kofleriaceae bacterium]